MKHILLILPLFLISCVSVNEKLETRVDEVSCRMACRVEDKVIDESKNTCSCILKPIVKNSDTLLIESLSKKIDQLQEQLSKPEPAPVESIPASLAPNSSVVKKESADPLRDLLKEE